MCLCAAAELLSSSPTTTAESLLTSAPLGYEVSDIPTLGVMQAGSFSPKWVVAIEGCSYLLSDAPSAAVLDAWDDRDWTAVLRGLTVSLQNSQSVTPDDAFTSHGTCRVNVLDVDNTDTFGTLVNKRLSGAETTITATVDRNDTTVNVVSTTGFPASGEIFIGTECIGYTGTTATSFTGCTRGKYSPFAAGTAGATRFANHHRFGVDNRYVQRQPTVTQVPRTWIGKRVGVYLHTWNEQAGTLNSRINAQLVYAGRIVGIGENPDSFQIELELEHVGEEWKSAVIGRDLWSATIADGVDVRTGRVFKFFDNKSGSATLTANDLTVVASGAAGTNQINAGRYSLSMLCEALSAWLAGERAASRIYGFYSWASPVTSNVGLRTKCYWRIEHASSVDCSWTIEMPGEISAFLGLHGEEPGVTGVSAKFAPTPNKRTNVDHIAQGFGVPFATIIFRPSAPGRLGQEFNDESIRYAAQDERGTFTDQRALMPAAIKSSCPEGADWGIFLLDDKALMVGSYDGGTLVNCWLAPFQLTADNSTEAVGYIGRRADEPAEPVTLRQVFIFEATLETIANTLAYSTGTAGYNHATYDTLGYGLGVGMPGAMLGPEFERSVSNLPGYNAPLAIVIDEPTRLIELLQDDLRLRRAFLRWKDQHFELAKWRTPHASLAVATLNEANKAAPASNENVNHRTASLETDEHQRQTVKIDYCRDFAVGRNGQYLKSVQIEDQTAYDGSGAIGAKSITLKMRNVYAQFTNTGPALESLIPDYLATMPLFSEAVRQFSRSIDLRLFEGLAPGDIVEVEEDDFARDPITGRRGIASRAAVVTRHAYDFDTMVGELEIMFLDVQRGNLYAPAAEVNSTVNLGGFSAGYNSTSKTLRCIKNEYSHTLTIVTFRGTYTFADAPDASNIDAGDEITIVEIDPPDPAAPLTWQRAVVSRSGNDIVHDGVALAGWDATKKYRVTFATFSDCQASQQNDYVFQADDADGMVENTDPAYHFSADGEDVDFMENDAGVKGELIPNLAFGDGKPWDAGHDHGLGHTANALIDYRTAHQSPTLWAEYTDSGGGAGWGVVYFGPIFLGTEQLSTAVTRSLFVSPWFRSANGGLAEIRVTLSRTPMTSASAADVYSLEGEARFTDHFSQAEWSTTSTTWQTGEAKELSLNVKDLTFGYAWITIEGRGADQSRGLARVMEGPRTVAA